jgi:hypothetical protein
MTMNSERPPFEPAPSPEDLRRDARLEVILDEMVKSSPALDDSFTRRIVEARPFAPWEVRSAPAWKLPAAAGSGLLAASLAVFLAPLWHLGPGTAFGVWGRVLAATFSGTISAALSSAPAVAANLARVFGQSPDVRNAALAGLALAGGSLGTLALVSRRRRSVTARAER